ncbi:MAG: hypothetical protein OH335_04350 [Candidatus Parvarchaeota archaeon]|nr:hypothetical protein [Candidatus Jingweiarchaeum tengchongense]
MFDFFTFLLSFVVLFVWVFESKATSNFKYPALFGFFMLTEYVAIPYAVMSLVYGMSFQYAQLATYLTYQVGLEVSVLVLSVAFVVKVANKYFVLEKRDSSDKKE